jgi:hypothetical protein
MKHPTDAPLVGLILCKTHDRITAEYALRDIAKPIDCLLDQSHQAGIFGNCRQRGLMISSDDYS